MLAQHVLEGKTKGYKNHPQLDRFKEVKTPVDAINQYLAEVYEEATHRGYRFNSSKIDWDFKKCTMEVTKGQLEYEVSHLLNKLQSRDPKRFEELQQIKIFDTHPLFTLVEGPIASWEILTGNKAHG